MKKYRRYDCKGLVSKQDKLRCTNELWIDDCKCENDIKEDTNKNKNISPLMCKCNNSIGYLLPKENGSSSDHSHDCGYSSENNNGCCETGSLVSSISSSPEGSELACDENYCCQLDADYLSRGRYGQHPSLQEMLEVSQNKREIDSCGVLFCLMAYLAKDLGW